MHIAGSASSRYIGVLLRAGLAIGGGFAFTTAIAGLLAVGLPLAFGMARGDAMLASAMAGFLIYLGAIVWAYTMPPLRRVAAVFLGGGVLMGLAAQQLAASLAVGAP